MIVKGKGMEENEEERDFDEEGYCPFTTMRRCTRGKTGGYSENLDCDTCGERCW